MGLVELSKKQIEAMIRRHLSEILSPEMAEAKWKITRMGSRGIEITIVDEAYERREMYRTKRRVQRRIQ